MAGLPPEIPGTEPTFLQSDAALARVARPIARFLSVEAAGGVVLLAAAVVALVWANSPWQASYTSFWATELELKVGPFLFQEDLAHWVNDALMAVFFFVVGLEIKREVVTGELRDHRAIALPALAALGGMVVPAAIYSTFRRYEPGHLEEALDRFLQQLNGHDVEWRDHNLLVHVRRRPC